LLIGTGSSAVGQPTDPTADRDPPVSDGVVWADLRWFVELNATLRDQERVEELRQEFIEKRIPALPAVRPLVAKNTVLTRTPWHLFAIERDTGKRVWHYPWNVDVDAAFFEEGRSRSRMQLIRQRAWYDILYGQFTTDGSQVILIDELGLASPEHVGVRTFGGCRRRPNPTSQNRLCAFDLAEEGKLRWTVGGTWHDGDARLKGVFFLGCPLVHSEHVYVLAERHASIELVVLDAKTGGLKWLLPLLSVGELTISKDRWRRLAGASPSIADDVVVCPTSAGAVVAVDRAQKAVRWKYVYGRRGVALPDDLFAPEPDPFARLATEPGQPGSCWADATATISGSRVLATPVESTDLHCLDLHHGTLKWKMSRDEFLFVACVHEGTVLLVGKDQVQGYRLTDGEPAWAAKPLPATGMPSGRGFVMGGEYYLPTTAEQIVRINVRSGDLLEPIKTRGVLGNLVCHEGALISQGVVRLAKFGCADSQHP
jgi:outer membrane protein assembly factor BamB